VLLQGSGKESVAGRDLRPADQYARPLLRCRGQALHDVVGVGLLNPLKPQSLVQTACRVNLEAKEPHWHAGSVRRAEELNDQLSSNPSILKRRGDLDGSQKDFIGSILHGQVTDRIGPILDNLD